MRRVVFRTVAIWLAGCVSLLRIEIAMGALLLPPTIVDNQHVDISVPLVGGVWQPFIDADDEGAVPRNEGLLYFNDLTRISIPTAIPYIGNTPNQTFWVGQQNLLPGAIYLGFNAYMNSADSASVLNWTTGDVRAPGSHKWIDIQLVDVRGYGGGPAPGEFSLWQTLSFGQPLVWMSTADGGITNNDRAYIGVGGHVHYNWGFTAPGVYEIDFRLRTMTTSGEQISEPFTFYFGVETIPQALEDPGPGPDPEMNGPAPEPTSLALAGLGACCLARARRKNLRS